ncbi:hypothetical protein ACFLRU_03695 [Bacteroidota bacterium]
MLPFRTEIRNSPKEQTIKVYLSDISLDIDLQGLLEKLSGVRMVEVQKSISRNRAAENLTVFRDESTSINDLKTNVDAFLENYFERVDI